MKLRNDLDKILSDLNWKCGATLSYKGMRRIIIEALGVYDRRTIIKWLGQNKTTFKKVGDSFSVTRNKKVKVWEIGFLEEFDYVIPYFDNTLKGIFFMVIKDKTTRIEHLKAEQDITNNGHVLM